MPSKIVSRFSKKLFSRTFPRFSPLVFPWLSVLSMALAWHGHGFSTAFLWVTPCPSHGFPMVHPFSHGCPMVFPWLPHGYPNGFPTVSPALFLLFFPWFSAGFPMVAYCSPMASPWFSSGFSRRCPTVFLLFSRGFPNCFPMVFWRWFSHVCSR